MLQQKSGGAAITTPRVWNVCDPMRPKGAVYIGRRNLLVESKYANPFIIGIDGDRDTVCDLYESYADQRFTDAEVRADLGGKSVMCWCAPLRCHGDYLVRRANA